MKILLEIEGGFTKEIFEGDKAEVTFFVRGWKDVATVLQASSNEDEALSKFLGYVLPTTDNAWFEGCKARLANSKGKLKVVD